MSGFFRLFFRYDRLVALIFGAIMTFAMIYFKFNMMLSDTDQLKNRVSVLVSGAERMTVFMERQIIIDQHQNEILSDLKESMKYTWRSGGK